MGARKGRRVKIVLPKLTDYEAIDPPDYSINPVAAKLWAKAAWFTTRYPNQELADLIKVDVSTIKLWVRGSTKRSGWKYEKELYEKKAIKNFVVSNSYKMDSILSRMLDVFDRGIKEIEDSNQTLNVGEMSALSNSFEKLFKARQLSIGAPTDIFTDANGKSLTWNQIRNELQSVDILDYSLAPVAKCEPRGPGSLENCKDDV